MPKVKKAPAQSKRLQRQDLTVRFGGRAPRKGYVDTEAPVGWSRAYHQLQRVARAHGKRSSGRSGGGGSGAAAPRWKTYRQRVFVKTGYVGRKGTPGAWRAKGYYIQRESATKGFGFSEGEGQDKPSRRMGAWEQAGDQRLWWMWISPEFGRDLDLEEFTRSLIAEIERDLGYQLEWVAAVHDNTDHPHVHVGIRGVTKDGKDVALPREYIKRGLHDRATRLATNRLGYRTDADISQAQRAMVLQYRFTDLDREIAKRRSPEGLVWADSADIEKQGLALATELHVEQRLAHLVGMGLAEQAAEKVWRVSERLESILRAAQKVQDRLHTIQHYGIMSSDPRLPFVYADWREVRSIEGRVLVHGQDDARPVPYVLIESTEGKIVYLEHRNEIQAARAQGMLEPGAYIAMRVAFVDHKPHWIVEDYGDAEKALREAEFIDGCLRRGVVPAPDYGGWLGALRELLAEARYQREAGYPMGPAHDPGQSRTYSPNPSASDHQAADRNTFTEDGRFEDDGIPSARRAFRRQPVPILTPEDARAEFREFCEDMGLIFTAREGGPIMDGEWHRVPVQGGQPGNRSGSYKGHLNGPIPAGFVENFKATLRASWHSSAPTERISNEERARQQAAWEQQRQKEELEREARWKDRAAWSQKLWKRALPIESHAYLARKHVPSYGLRVDRYGNLLVPMTDHAGVLWNVQRIHGDGQKIYVKNARKMGLFATLGDPGSSDVIQFAEGYATGASIYRATGVPVVITFDSGNILPVVTGFREHYPNAHLLIAGDNDHHLPKRGLANQGLQKAEAAANAVGGHVLTPEFAESDKGTDWNDYEAQHGREAVRTRFAQALAYVRGLGHGRKR